MLASTMRPSGATSSTGLGSALRMASLSEGTGRRCSAAGVMQQHSMQNRRMRFEAIDARLQAHRKSGSFDASSSGSPPEHGYTGKPSPAPSRDVFAHA